MNKPIGTVYLVGAGPGDPGLITVRGVDCLAQADVVLYDYLVNPQVLRHAPPSAELVCLGRHGQGRIMTQREVNQQLVAAARRGQTVVRSMQIGQLNIVRDFLRRPRDRHLQLLLRRNLGFDRGRLLGCRRRSFRRFAPQFLARLFRLVVIATLVNRLFDRQIADRFLRF